MSAVMARHGALSRRELARHRPLKSSGRCFFSQIPWRKKRGGLRGAESLSEKKANREHREARLKHSQCEHSAPLSTASTCDFPKHDTLSVIVISVQGIPACLIMTARHLQQRCAEICSSSKAFLDLTG